MIDLSYYGTLAEAQQYFAMQLHSTAWDFAEPKDRPKALLAATKIIDALNYKGVRHTVYVLLQSMIRERDPSDVFYDTYLARLREDQLRAAELAQPLEFPRGSDTTVPADIRRACYECAIALLDGKDPQQELENLQITAMGMGLVRTHYERSQVPQRHILNGVPSFTAWCLLQPFLRDGSSLKVSRT
jgi:hypothetical protein